MDNFSRGLLSLVGAGGKKTVLSWTTLEEDYILTWGPGLKPV
jgi:hypothetical protein